MLKLDNSVQIWTHTHSSSVLSTVGKEIALSNFPIHPIYPNQPISAWNGPPQSMNITVKTTTGASQLSHRPPPSDLSRRKTPRRKTKTFGGGLRSERESSKRSVHRDTPLVKWMLDEFTHKSNSVEKREKSPPEVARKSGGTVRPAVSARKLGAGIWRLQSPEFGTNGRQSLGFQVEFFSS